MIVLRMKERAEEQAAVMWAMCVAEGVREGLEGSQCIVGIRISSASDSCAVVADAPLAAIELVIRGAGTPDRHLETRTKN